MPSPSKTPTDSGAITAEFAVTLPVVVASVLFAVGAIATANSQLQVQQLAGFAVRALSQGEPEDSVRQALKSIDPLTVLATGLNDGVICAEVSKPLSGAMKLLEMVPQAKACSWVGKYFEP